MIGRLYLLLVAGLVTAHFTNGQQLTMYPRFGGAHFEYTKDTVVSAVSLKQVTQIMGDDPVALAEFKKAKTNNSVAGVLGFIGGVMIGFPLGTAIVGGEPEWGLAAGGAALIVASIPLTVAYKRHAQNAVDIYNKNHTALRPRADYYLSGLGVKVVIRF